VTKKNRGNAGVGSCAVWKASAGPTPEWLVQQWQPLAGGSPVQAGGETSRRPSWHAVKSRGALALVATSLPVPQGCELLLVNHSLHLWPQGRHVRGWQTSTRNNVAVALPPQQLRIAEAQRAAALCAAAAPLLAAAAGPWSECALTAACLVETAAAARRLLSSPLCCACCANTTMTRPCLGRPAVGSHRQKSSAPAAAKQLHGSERTWWRAPLGC
jgi:hypothetical protein